MKHILIAFISGCIFGAAMVLTKLWLSPLPVESILLAPELYLIFAIGIAGFFLMQVAFGGRKASQITLVMTAAATSLPIVSGLLIGEILTMYETIGIMLLLTGAFTLLYKGI